VSLRLQLGLVSSMPEVDAAMGTRELPSLSEALLTAQVPTYASNVRILEQLGSLVRQCQAGQAGCLGEGEAAQQQPPDLFVSVTSPECSLWTPPWCTACGGMAAMPWLRK
jgi:hypothetical protein